MQKERNALKKQLSSKKDVQLKDLKILSLSLLPKMKEMFWREQEGVAQQSLDKGISMGLDYRPD